MPRTPTRTRTTDDDALPAGALLSRLAAQLLTRPNARNPDDVVRHLLAVQAQDRRGARLAVRSRTCGLTAADVDAALTDRRLVVVWLNRGTLHLVAAEDYWWLHPLTNPQLETGNRRRLAQEGVSPEQAERGVEIVSRALVDEGPSGRERLRVLLDAGGVPTRRQALVHVLVAASLRGLLVRGPVLPDGEQAFVDPVMWLGEPPAPLDDGEALGRLARRYLAGHAPARAADLAMWAGITIRAARHGLKAAGCPMDGTDFAHAPREGGSDEVIDAAPTEVPAPRLLGPFDPVLHGWASRAPIVGAHQGVVTSNGIFKASALVDGRAVGTWTLPGGRVTLTPLEPLHDDVLAALADDARDVHRFLRLPERPMDVAPTRWGPAGP